VPRHIDFETGKTKNQSAPIRDCETQFATNLSLHLYFPPECDRAHTDCRNRRCRGQRLQKRLLVGRTQTGCAFSPSVASRTTHTGVTTFRSKFTKTSTNQKDGEWALENSCRRLLKSTSAAPYGGAPPFSSSAPQTAL
jgi:hypothetical protein